MTPAERGYEAKRLLNNEVLKDAINGIRDNLVSKMEASAIGDRDLHHEIALSLQILVNLQRQLYKWIAEGQLEESRNKGK
jgi:hypothetical protein